MKFEPFGESGWCLGRVAGAASALLVLVLTSVSYASPRQAMELHDLLEDSGLVAEVRVQSVDVQAGGANGPLTEVEFDLANSLAGTPPASSWTVFLPEGQTTSASFIETAGTPKFLEGNEYLLFFRDGSWVQSPITDWKFSAFQDVSFESTEYYAFFDGRCVADVTSSAIVPGPYIALPAAWSGPVINGDIAEMGGRRTPHLTPQDYADNANNGGCLSKSAFVEALSGRINELGFGNMSTNLVQTSTLTDTAASAVDDTVPTEHPEVELLCLEDGSEKICEDS